MASSSLTTAQEKTYVISRTSLHIVRNVIIGVTVLFIVAVLDFACTVADGSYTLALFYVLLPSAVL